MILFPSVIERIIHTIQGYKVKHIDVVYALVRITSREKGHNSSKTDLTSF